MSSPTLVNLPLSTQEIRAIGGPPKVAEPVSKPSPMKGGAKHGRSDTEVEPTSSGSVDSVDKPKRQKKAQHN